MYILALWKERSIMSNTLVPRSDIENILYYHVSKDSYEV